MDERRKIYLHEVESELDFAMNELIEKLLNFSSPFRVNFVRNDSENFCRVTFAEAPQYNKIFDVSGFFHFFQGLHLYFQEDEELKELRLDLEYALVSYRNHENIPGTQYHSEKIKYGNLVLEKSIPAPQNVVALSLIQRPTQAANVQPQTNQQVIAEKQASMFCN